MSGGSASEGGTISVLGIGGSLRRNSYNRALLRAAAEIAPEEMAVTIWERLGEIPLFNADVEAQGDPEPVTAFKEAIRAADALLIATPEYQHSMPGVLKNAVDWASRPPGKAALQGKPVAIMGASPGMTGTARAQAQLRLVLVYNAMPAVLRPEVLVARANEKIDADGRLIDESARTFIGQLLTQLLDLTRLWRRGR